jgi:hypothetical protein
MENQITENLETVVASDAGKLLPFRMPTTEFKVFLDQENSETAVLLNKIRNTASPETIIKAVALVRGLQVGASYARKYAPHLTFEIEEELTKLLAEVCGSHLIS